MSTECYVKAWGDEAFTRIDLEAGVAIPVTFNVMDIRKPDATSAHWSKTFRVPGTKTNNQLFQHIFEIGIDGRFNPNKKADVYFLQDTLEVLRGVLQLRKINRTSGLSLIYYECVAFGGNDDLFSKIADKKLTDLDFSGYNHAYTRANIIDSWDNIPGSGYVYPMIDYKGNKKEDLTWYVDDFYPALFAKEYIDKIFTYAEKKYSSAFLTSDFFKKLIIPYNREAYKYSDEEVALREFRTELTSDYDLQLLNTSNSATGIVYFDNTSTGENYDPSSLYSAGSGKWTVPAGKAGKYKIQATANLDLRFSTSSGTLDIAFPLPIYVNLHIHVNGKWVGSDGGQITLNQYASFLNGQVISVKPKATAVVEQFLKEGDEVKVVYNINTPSILGVYITGSNPKIYGRVAAGAYFQNGFQQELVEGSTLEINKCVPEDVQMRDFLLSIIDMFRLYVEQDRDNPDNYIIEPRDDYYTSCVVDWSGKLDYDKGLEITPMAELQGRRYTFRYKDDKDYWNTDYQDRYKLDGKPRTYGDFVFDVNNDFVTNEVTIQPIFSPTPSYGSDFHSRVIPVTYGGDGSTLKQIGTNIRILYWGGLKSADHWYLFSRLVSSSTLQEEYPYAGHVDDPFNATLDLSFDCPKEVQWITQRRAELTDATLYNVYHARAVQEITDPDARIVSGYFRLKPTDIFQLSFRKLYYFEKEFYRLNKIIDYDLDEEKLIKCEFIKALDPGKYVPTTRFVVGGNDTINSGGTILPVKPPAKPIYDNYHNPQENVVTGTNNYVPLNSHGVIIVGDDNVVGGSCSNINIIGSDNYVYGGVENVTLIQCSGLQVTQSDQLWINNCQVEGCPVGQEAIDSSVEDRSGQAELVDSTVTVINGLVTTGSVIIITPVDYFTGNLTVTAGAGSFNIDSSIVAENGTVNYFIAKF